MKKVDVLYTASLCSKKTEQKLLDKDPKCIGIQIQKYHRLLVKGLFKSGENVQVLSYQNGIEKLDLINRENEFEGGVYYTYLKKDKYGYIKLLINSFTYALGFFMKNNSSVMICDVLNFTVSIGSVLASRILNRKTIGIITDFPEHLSGKTTIKSWLVWRLIGLCDGYIVLTDQMKERLNHKKKAIVLEGHVDSDMQLADNSINNKHEKKVCLYAGMLHRKYGIEKLVKAFLSANVDDAELHIYGDGDYANQLKSIKNTSIKYYGIVPNNTVVEEELKATLLINPRPTDEVFTKYSFPSKNMEYMASGTPILTTKLPGMPDEYLDYIYTFEDESVNGMKETLEEILKKPREELHKMGIRARDFTISNKSEVIQAERIIRFFDF